MQAEKTIRNRPRKGFSIFSGDTPNAAQVHSHRNARIAIVASNHKQCRMIKRRGMETHSNSYRGRFGSTSQLHASIPPRSAITLVKPWPAK